MLTFNIAKKKNIAKTWATKFPKQHKKQLL